MPEKNPEKEAIIHDMEGALSIDPVEFGYRRVDNHLIVESYEDDGSVKDVYKVTLGIEKLT